MDIELMNINLPVPDHSTVSRRLGRLKIELPNGLNLREQQLSITIEPLLALDVIQSANLRKQVSLMTPQSGYRSQSL